MTSSNGNIFSVTGPLCGELPITGEFPTQRPGMRSFDVFFDPHRVNGWVNNPKAGDFRRRRAHYDVTVIHPSPQCRIYTPANTVSIGSVMACRQAITWTDADFFFVNLTLRSKLRWNSELQRFAFTKMHLTTSSAKWRPFWSGEMS